MAAERANFPVKMMARLLAVSRSGFCSWLSKGPGPDPWAQLRSCVERTWLDSGHRFGARSILHTLPPEFVSA